MHALLLAVTIAGQTQGQSLDLSNTCWEHQDDIRLVRVAFFDIDSDMYVGMAITLADRESRKVFVWAGYALVKTGKTTGRIWATITRFVGRDGEKLHQVKLTNPVMLNFLIANATTSVGGVNSFDIGFSAKELRSLHTWRKGELLTLTRAQKRSPR